MVLEGEDAGLVVDVITAGPVTIYQAAYTLTEYFKSFLKYALGKGNLEEE